MSKFNCFGCEQHHVVESKEKPNACVMGKYFSGAWHEVPANQPPKLTIEELEKRGIKWPEWATGAVVGHDGVGAFFKGAVRLNHAPDYWYGMTTSIPGKWDASDWQNSLIQRPEKKEKLPDWCKVGAWCWTERTGYFIVTEIEGGSCICGKSSNGEGQTVLHEKLSEARLRPWTVAEMKQKVGKVFDGEKDRYLAMAFVYDKLLLATGGEPTLYTADGLISMGFMLDGSHCGTLEHREGEGWMK